MFSSFSTKFPGILGAVALTFAFGAAMAFDWSDQTAIAKWSSPLLYLEGTDLMDAIQAETRTSAATRTHVQNHEPPQTFASGRYASPHMESAMLMDAIASARPKGAPVGPVMPDAILDAYKSFDFNPYAAPHMDSAAMVDLYRAAR